MRSAVCGSAFCGSPLHRFPARRLPIRRSRRFPATPVRLRDVTDHITGVIMHGECNDPSAGLTCSAAWAVGGQMRQGAPYGGHFGVRCGMHGDWGVRPRGTGVQFNANRRGNRPANRAACRSDHVGEMPSLLRDDSCCFVSEPTDAGKLDDLVTKSREHIFSDFKALTVCSCERLQFRASWRPRTSRRDHATGVFSGSAGCENFPLQLLSYRHPRRVQ